MCCSSIKYKMEYPPEEVTMNINEDLKQFKKENENDDLEELKQVEQQNLERNQKVALMRFDEQIDEKEFTAFLRVYAKEITSVLKNARSLRGPRHIFDKVLDSDYSDQYLKYSVCEKADEILYKFCVKHPQIKQFYNKTSPAALAISRREAALVYCLRSYLQEKDPSLIFDSLFLKNLFFIFFDPYILYIPRFLLEVDVLNRIDPMFHFSSHWKYQKTLWFSYTFRMSKNGTFAQNCCHS